LGHRDIGTLGHWDIGTLGYWDIGPPYGELNKGNKSKSKNKYKISNIKITIINSIRIMVMVT
jgi:hypothetical protein